jgi:hypothetical protein
MRTDHPIVLAIRQALATFEQACKAFLFAQSPAVAPARRAIKPTESALRRAKGRLQP